MAAVVFQRGSCAVASPAVQRVYFALAYLLYRRTEPQTWHCIGSEWSLKRVDRVAGVDVQTTSAWEVRAVFWTGAAIELVVYITAPNTVVYICFTVFVNLQFHVGTLASLTSQPTPPPRKGLVQLRTTSCVHAKILAWPIRFVNHLIICKMAMHTLHNNYIPLSFRGAGSGE